MDIWISANGIVLVNSKDRYPLEAMLIPRKVTEVIPTHSVDIRLTDLFGKHRVMSSQKRVQIFEANKILLLDDLGIYVGRPQGLDVRNKKISDPLDSLRLISTEVVKIIYVRYLICQVIQEWLNIRYGRGLL